MCTVNLNLARRILVFLAACVLSQPIFATSTAARTPKIYLAGAAAHKAFSEQIVRKGEGSELSSFLGKISNYEVHLSEEAGYFLVVFVPRAFKGETLRGGGASFKVGKEDFRIIESLGIK